MNSFFANGKLLITGEYLVLNGALALAVPTKKGQTLLFEDEQGSSLNWESLDPDNNCWFSCKFSSKDLTIIKTSDQKKRYTERQKQVDLAKKRNNKHIGAVLKPSKKWPQYSTVLEDVHMLCERALH